MGERGIKQAFLCARSSCDPCFVKQQASCAPWLDAPATDSVDGTEGFVDHYVAQIEPPRGVDVDSVFFHFEDRLFRYDIFPPTLMRAKVCSDDERLREGTTIVQHVAVGPFTLVSAVRVARVWHVEGADGIESGFSYVTLEGHPERGVSSFRLSRTADGRIMFSIDARSRPGSLLTRIGRPFARRFQRGATEAALAHFVAGR